MSRRAQQHMARLTPLSREVLLLSTIEEFRIDEVAAVLDTSPDDTERLLKLARTEMEDSISGKVLIIEDEAIIAMDIEAIVSGLGHLVTGIARTRDAAVELGRSLPPDLILADIQLADNSSGIDAVNVLLRDFSQTPAIFITAFPSVTSPGTARNPHF